MACLAETPQNLLLAFYAFPAQATPMHMRTVPTSIESTFAINAPQDHQVPRAAVQTHDGAPSMVLEAVLKPDSIIWYVAWTARTRHADIIQGVKFKDGEKLTERAA